MTKARWLAVTCGVILIVVTLAGIEITAGFFVPPWPARALRSESPLIGPIFNSWGMNDRHRDLVKPPDVRFRSVFVGDSFVDAGPHRLSLPEAVDRLAGEHGLKGLEEINLGVSGTDPRSYYFRTRDVALALAPDAVLVFFFSGNDFLQPGEGFGDRWIPPLVDESPGNSLLGRVMPRTNWLLVNRLRMSEVLRGNKPIPHETETLNAIAHGPPDQRIPGLVRHMKHYYFPELGDDRLAEILSRGGERFWQAFERRGQDQESLQGWMLNLMVGAEVGDNPAVSVRTPEDAARKVSGREIEATLSWLVALDKLALKHKVPVRIFVIPPANVSPDFVEFWKPWPRYLGWYILSDVRHQRLVEALGHSGVPFVDLRNDLLEVRGAYRMTDAHWTEKGLQIAAGRVYRELSEMVH